MHDANDKSSLFHEHHQDEDEDDEMFDDEETKMMRDFRERRMAELKNNY